MKCFPTELISLVLGHIPTTDLYQCTLVSRAFYRESNPLLWRHLTLDTQERLAVVSTSLVSQGNHVRSLTLPHGISDSQLLLVLPHVPLLEHLRCEDARTLTLSHFLEYCPRLESLYVFYGHVTSAFMQALSPTLTSLTLQACVSLDPLPPLSTSLHTLHISGPVPVSPGYADTTARALQSCLLTSLELQDPQNDYTTFITTALDFGLWPLTHLGLMGCRDMGDDLAIRLIQAIPDVLTLELMMCNISDKTLDAIPIYLPHLQSVNVDHNENVTLNGLTQLANVGKALQDISCSLCGLMISEDEYEAMDPSLYFAYSDMGQYEIVALTPQH